MPDRGLGWNTIPWLGCHIFCGCGVLRGRGIVALYRNLLLGLHSLPNSGNTYTALAPFTNIRPVLIDSVGKDGIPATPSVFMVLTSGRRSDLANVDAPY
jgi:hypothetical protein